MNIRIGIAYYILHIVLAKRLNSEERILGLICSSNSYLSFLTSPESQFLHQ